MNNDEVAMNNDNKEFKKMVTNSEKENIILLIHAVDKQNYYKIVHIKKKN